MQSRFGSSLTLKAKHFPKHRVAVIFGDKKITWKELSDRVNKLANALLDFGIKKGDKCAILYRNSPEFVEANFAIQKIGAIVVPVNYRFVASELEYVLKHSDSKVLFLEKKAVEAVQSIRSRLGRIEKYICVGESSRNDFF